MGRANRWPHIARRSTSHRACQRRFSAKCLISRKKRVSFRGDTALFALRDMSLYQNGTDAAPKLAEPLGESRRTDNVGGQRQ